MTSRPARVLVEHPSGLVLLDLAEELERAGFEVLTCAGPTRLPGGRCPLVDGEGCEAAASADVIVNGLGSGQIEVYAAQRARLPGTPVCVELDDRRTARLRGVVDGVRSSGPLPGGSALVDRVREALAGRRGPDQGTDGRPLTPPR